MSTIADSSQADVAFRTSDGFTVYPLYDGPLPTTLDKIPDPDQRQLAKALIENAGEKHLIMNVYAFLILSPTAKYLVDAGAGSSKGPALGKVPEQLAALGVDAAEITKVFMTHLHFDHFGGLVAAHGATFPNARIVVFRKEAEFWLDTPESSLPPRATRSLDVLRGSMALYHGRIDYVGEEEVVTGIRTIPAHGHSHGHVGWLIGSGAQSIMAWGDLIHIAAIHLAAPAIAFEYDLYPEQALESRLRVLGWLADDRIHVAGSHLPTPGIGQIEREGSTFRFVPWKPELKQLETT